MCQRGPAFSSAGRRPPLDNDSCETRRASARSVDGLFTRASSSSSARVASACMRGMIPSSRVKSAWDR
jgi:hypothetical protein